MYFFRKNISKCLFIIFFLICSCNNSSDRTKKESKESKKVTIKELQEEAERNYQDDNFTAAVTLYDCLISQDSLTGEYYYKRGYSLSQIRKHKLAIKDYSKSAELNYRRFDAYYSLGIIYDIIFLNDSLAIFYFKKALEEKPDSEEVRKILKDLESLEDEDMYESVI